MTRPVSDDTPLFILKKPRFLQPEDLTVRWKVQSMTVPISRLIWEDTTPNPKDLDPETADDKHPKGKPKVVEQPVLYFKTRTGDEFPRGVLLSAKENIDSLGSATGATTAGEMIGKRITIVVEKFRGKDVLRISPDKPPAPKKKEQAPAGEKDVIKDYSDICNRAGLDQETQTAILRECGGDFETATQKVTKQYKEILA